jgi:hypothetical protein
LLEAIGGDMQDKLTLPGRPAFEIHRTRAGAYARRRRMSVERLALCHVAAVRRGPEADRARAEISVGEVDGLLFGETFLETLLLSGPFLDLYEEEAHIVRGAEARELIHFDSSLSIPAEACR